MLAWSVVVGVGVTLVAAFVSGLALGQIEDQPWGWTVALIFALLGVRFATHSSVNPLGWLMLSIAVSAALSVLTETWSSVPVMAWLGAWLWLPAYTLIPAVALVFPDGRLVSGRWWPALALIGLGTLLMTIGLGAAAAGSPTTFWDDAVAGRIERGWAIVTIAAGLGCVTVGLLAGLFSLVLRWLRTPEQRPMLGWAVACALLTIVAGVLEAVVGSAFWALTALALPAAAIVAVLRYGLFDIALLIHRSVLYASLSLTLLGLYVAVAYAATLLVPQQSAAVAAVVVALAVFPLRALLQRRVDRWLYGDRSEPYQALSGLSRRLESSLGVDEVLPAIAQYVAAALKSPYVRASVITDSRRGTVQVGRSRGWPAVSFPMTFRGARIGEIVVENRAPDERYGTREVRLLAALASGAGPAAHALVLTEDLRLARERIVLAREEERRRLRRDLHDGVGAGLAGAVMQLRTAGRRLPDVERARIPLETATQDLIDLTAEVRRVVDGLRPASLDRGLAGALSELAAGYAGTALAVEVDVDQRLTALPAAVEVAAYHIAQEAVANVARHAHASHCRVEVTLERASVRLAISDDGRGLSLTGPTPGRPAGIGLSSMRERAAELGGLLDVEPVSPSGTRVLAVLPTTPVGGEP